MDVHYNSVDELPTPLLVLDAVVVHRNINRLAKYAASIGIGLRPHTKTHKLRWVAQLQLEAGAIGLTTAKASEAEVISSPQQDVFVAYPPVGRGRAARTASLARDRTVRAAVDSLAAIREMSQAACAANTTVGLLVDLDVGLGRTGVPSPEDSLSLAQAVDAAPNVRLDGIMVYPGHIWAQRAEQGNALADVDELITHAIALWSRHGLRATIVSGGSTPTAYQSHFVRSLTEIRPGTYVFNDMNTVRGGYCLLDDCAARVVTTVVSEAVPNQVVIDAGSKTLTSDLCLPAKDKGFGHVVEYPDAVVRYLSEEHGQVDISKCASRPVLGERITIIPNHICPCVNLHELVWWNEPGESLRPLAVDARGKIQ